MIVALYVLAGVFAVLLVATMAFSSNWLAGTVRGTVRQGVLGALVVAPVAFVLAVFGVCIYAIVSSILYVLEMIE